MFASLKLRYRVLLGYLAPLVLLVGAMTLVSINVHKAQQASDRLEQYRKVEDGAYSLHLDIAIMQRTARGYMLQKNLPARRVYDDHEKAFHEKESLLSLVDDPRQLDTLRRVLQLGGELHDLTRRQIDLVDDGKADEAIGIFRSGVTSSKADELERLINRFLQRATEQRQEQQGVLAAALDAVRRSIWIGAVGSILISVAIAWWLASALSSRISAYAVQLASAASEIAATVTQHERTASQQAAAANETSSTIEELSAFSRQSAEQAASAAAMAEQATRNTTEGSDNTRRTVAAMNALKDKINLMAQQILRLSEQSGQIGSIAGLVKDLAGEINMLALNAAVEASRAGEHGKGFAVVASEVRKLADQSKKSGERTGSLITEIQKATDASILMTEDGSRMVAEVTEQTEQMGILFEQLANLVANLNVNAQQVMLNAKQQAAAFNQMVEASSSISVGAKETAVGISQTKAAVEQLNQAAQSLRAMA